MLGLIGQFLFFQRALAASSYLALVCLKETSGFPLFISWVVGPQGPPKTAVWKYSQ